MIKDTRVETKCVICGKEFVVYNSKNAKYCSKRCKDVVLFNYRNGTNFKTVEELEYYKQNSSYRGAMEKKPVMQFRLDGTYVRTVPSVYLCDSLGDEKGCFARNSVARCARGERNTYRGYYWIYKEDYSLEELQRRMALVKKRHNEKRKPVVVIDTTGNVVARYNSITDGAEGMFVSRTSLCAHLAKKVKHNTCVGYVWMYEQDYLERKVI